jgi:hypothetical protein
VADFCPLCRSLRPFRLRRVTKVRHLYWIPLGQGRFLGNEIECRVCRTSLGTDMARYATVASALPPDVEELSRRTLPPSDPRVHDLVVREMRVARGELAPTERERLLDDAIEHGAIQVQRQIQLLRYPPAAKVVGWIAAVAFVLATLGGYLNWPAPVGVPLGLLAIVSLITFFCLALTSIRSYVRRIVEPALGRALSPLKPSPDEIRAGIDRVSLRWDAACKLKPERLRAAIEASH